MVIKTQEERLPPECSHPPLSHISLAKEVLWGIRLSQPCGGVSVRSSGSFCSSPRHIQEQYLPVSSPAILPRTIRETTGKMCILYNFCWCPTFAHSIPLSPERWSIFSIITNLNLILGSAPEEREKKKKSNNKNPYASPITIPLVILSATAARDLPLANSQTTHLFPGLCCEASFFKHNKSSNFMSWAIADFSLWLQMGMVCTNESSDLCYCK